jgi:flagellin-like hook-associated protein FlgL
MIYRTSQRGTYRNINNNLSLLSWHIAQLSNKIASEKQINKPSDNPSGAATVLRTRTTLSEIAQHTENTAYSSNWLTNTGNVMDSIKGVLDEIYVKAEQAATDVYNADQRKIIATEIDELFKTIIQFGDSRFGDNYLLSGQKTETQPFSNELRAQDVIAGCENSDLFTGQVLNAGDRTYASRPDLPIQSQEFLIECVRAGGIDSSLYANQNAASLSQAVVTGAGGEYSLTLTATEQSYSETLIRFVAGPENNDSVGEKSEIFNPADSMVTFSAPAGAGPFEVTLTYGNSAGTYASQNSAGRVTVYLQTNAEGTESVATARDVAESVNLIYGQTGLSATAASYPYPGGIVELGSDRSGNKLNTKLSFNNGLSYSIKGDEITIYLERASFSEDPSGSLITTADELESFINSDPVLSQILTAELNLPATSDPFSPPSASPLVQTTGGFMSFVPSDPYTLAFAEAVIPGNHNDIVWSILNEPGAAKGEAGNSLSVRYDYSNPPDVTSETFARMSGDNLMIITLGTSGSLYLEEYARAYATPGSATFQNARESELKARAAAVTASATDVINAVASLSGAENPCHLGGKLSEGNSGLGKMTASSAISLSGGYDQEALFRVSQDGGKTWGPPTAFPASEYQGDLFYNSQLGHASLTTNLAGTANDIVLTANYMGTWGDDLRLEYREPNSANMEASVTVGPQSFNICVNLGTDSMGRVSTTASEIVSLINNHPEAGALVTASLKNYHEGGEGVVSKMDCVSLTTGLPYEVAGVTQITPLGYATGEVSFPYTPPDQKSPDLIYQALAAGSAGASLGVRYTMSADTAIYGDNALYQDHVSISYDTLSNGDKVVVVHLASTELPSCPDINTEREAYDAWRELYPVWSCSSDRTVTSTAGDVLEALIAKNLSSPQSALVWASMEYKDEGWDSTAKVGVTDQTVWLSGGDDGIKASDYGVGVKFIPDGTALREGDVYKVGVGWYNGDDKDLEVNVMSGYRTDMNTTGGELLGENGASDNVLDVIQRLYWALTHNYTEMVEAELPNLEKAVQKVTLQETNVGTKLIRNEFVANTLSDNQYAAESILSSTEDADFTRLITDLKNAQLVYEAVLGTTGLTTKLSLLNYI